MTTQYDVITALTGQTLTLKVFSDATPDTEVTGNTITVTERTNAKGQYLAAIVRTPTALPAGNYTLIYFNGSLPAAIGKRTFLGTDGETATETPAVAELDSTTAAKIDAILEDTGTTLPAAIAAIDAGGSGTGARTVTITVNDGTTALQNATVRMTEGANTFTALTNASGVAVFNLDDATYTVGITKSGYSYAGTTLIVNGTEAATYSMTLVSVTSPTNPDLSAIEVLCLGADFTASSGIDIDFRMAVIPSSDQNNAFPGAKVTVTSNVSGIARWEAPQGAAIEYKRGRADVWARVTLDSDSVTNVTSVIGSP